MAFVTKFKNNYKFYIKNDFKREQENLFRFLLS